MPYGKRWLEENPWYEGLPPFDSKTVVRCPTHNRDGSPIDEDDVPGCGSTNVIWNQGGEALYDCCECGIFFHDFAANPPHRRAHRPQEH